MTLGIAVVLLLPFDAIGTTTAGTTASTPNVIAILLLMCAPPCAAVCRAPAPPPTFVASTAVVNGRLERLKGER